MFGWGSAKGSQDKQLRIVGIEHIKARPVVVGQALRNDLDDEVLQGRKIVRGPRKCAYLGKNLGEGILGHSSILQERRHPWRFPRISFPVPSLGGRSEREGLLGD